MDARQVVEAINVASGRSLQVVGRLGGEAVGAWEVVDANGRREVLKFSSQPGWAAHFSRVAGVCHHLRAHGYPAPFVTDSGVVADVVAYYIQELVAGSPLLEQRRDATLTVDAVETMLRLNNLQAGVAPPGRPPGEGWSDYLEACLWGEQHEWAKLAEHGHSAIEELLGDLRAFLGTNRSGVFVRDDVVTGSFEPHNVLVDGGRVTAVVDLDAAGPGDRIIDMAALLRFDRQGTHTQRIMAEATRIGREWPIRAACIYWRLNGLYLATAAGEEPSAATQRARQRLSDIV